MYWTLVVGVHADYMDTEMVANIDAPKSRPEDIATRAIEGIIAGHYEGAIQKRHREDQKILKPKK